MISLVGSTGFVGSNLLEHVPIEGRFHSANIRQAYGASPDLLVYAGLRAEKYLANQEPERDMAEVEQAFANIRAIAPKRLVLISTVDVYKLPAEVDEETAIDTQGLHPYGLHRYRLERMVREELPDALIVRLPGLYGSNLKKNFVYDLIHRIPTMLRAEKFEELAPLSPLLREHYALQGNGFYKAGPLSPAQRGRLRAFFEGCGFSALQFTDHRARFQMYPLRFLWGHIRQALEAELTLLNLAVEPVTAGEIFLAAEGRPFVNELAGTPPDYRMRTRHAALLGGRDGYLLEKDFLLRDLADFIRRETLRLVEEGQ